MKLSPDAIKDGGSSSNRVDKLTERCEGKHAKEKMFSFEPPYFWAAIVTCHPHLGSIVSL